MLSSKAYKALNSWGLGFKSCIVENVVTLCSVDQKSSLKVIKIIEKKNFNTQSIGFPHKSEQAEGFSNEILIVASPMTVTVFRQCK